MADPLVETFTIHQRINQFLLDEISEEGLDASLGGKGRTVYGQFAHMHNVRLMWLKSAAPELLAGLDKLDAKQRASKPELAASLEASGQAIERLIEKGLAEGGKIKGFKPHATAFVGYLISHESHHRGQVGWTLKHAGLPLSQKVAFGLWEWGIR